MTEQKYDREDFREWLVSFEGEDRPFQKMCPIATWQQGDPLFFLYIEALNSDWMWRFVSRVDIEAERILGHDEWVEHFPDWSVLTVKDCLGILDGLELTQ